MSWNPFAGFDSPVRQANTIANPGIKGALIAQSENRRRSRSRTLVSHERQPQTVGAGVLIGKQTEHDRRLVHKDPQDGRIEAPFEKQAPGTFAQRLQQTVQGRLTKPAIRRRAFEGGGKLPKPRVDLKISEVPDRGNDALRSRPVLRAPDFRRSNKLNVLAQFGKLHAGGFCRTGKVFADSPKIFARDALNLPKTHFLPETHFEISQRHS